MAMVRGTLQKMAVRHPEAVDYRLRVGAEAIPMNPLLGRQVRIAYTGRILCEACGRQTKKSFNQGYCYPCFRSLAACDQCIVSPEKCHYAAGTCREPAWGEEHCMKPHVVYLANSSAVKVGITRAGQVPTRWMDQGAVQAMAIFETASRHLAGLLEVVFRQHVTDRTQYQAMLKSRDMVDLLAAREELLAKTGSEIDDLRGRFGLQAITLIEQPEVLEIRYPVLQYPEKVRSRDLEKDGAVEGTLLGLKGQYLLLDTGVLNIRKYTAYEVEFTTSPQVP